MSIEEYIFFEYGLIVWETCRIADGEAMLRNDIWVRLGSVLGSIERAAVGLF